MKNNLININKEFSRFSIFPILLLAILAIQGCKKDDPAKEDVPELITKATLTFTPNGGGSAVVVTATDPDGEGVKDIKVDGAINLSSNKTYLLTLELINGLAAATAPEYNVTDEVEEEGDEHIFFFAWTNNTFANPTGNGNIDARADAVNYTGGTNSNDANGKPLGLTTTWTTATATLSGAFRVLLKHQPGLKTDSSNSNAGETDLDLTFTLNVN